NHAESRVHVSFWEQSNSLLQAPRLWKGNGKKVSMLFWQNSMHGAADVVLTPKPEHTPDGKTLTACWSNPLALYSSLVAELGPFPLHNYWSPMAGLPSSQWIVQAAERVWERERPDVQLVYVPHLDYKLQRLGPNDPSVVRDLQEVDAVLAGLAAKVRGGGDTLMIAGDYGMYEVDTPIMPNLALREAGLLATKLDGEGKLLMDYDASKAFVMADHQVGFLYARDEALPRAQEVLATLAGVDRIVAAGNLQSLGLATARAGSAVLLARSNAWFAHDWWRNDGEKPRWQFGVDIHNKPGYDPRELFFDPARKCIAQDPRLVKGSHGLVGDAEKWPVVLSDHPIAGNDATGIFPR
ncbi:MAG TPA: alkaline phosphatase family protein, partial [Phycisphaerae bacterium]|nr:alkaline phosphatase family protein [Phycisphaerae bacterium]